MLAFGQAERVSDLDTTGEGSDPQHFLRLGSNTFFTAHEAEHGLELWVIPDGATREFAFDNAAS